MIWRQTRNLSIKFILTPCNVDCGAQKEAQ